MSRKSRRAAVSSGVTEVTDALQSVGESVADTVAKTSRRARKRAVGLAERAADALPGRPAKPRHRKRKVAVVVVVLAGAGVLAKKALGGKSDPGSGSRTPDE
jgi:hypothetical protein